jgi:hypothetical protein
MPGCMYSEDAAPRMQQLRCQHSTFVLDHTGGGVVRECREAVCHCQARAIHRPACRGGWWVGDLRKEDQEVSPAQTRGLKRRSTTAHTPLVQRCGVLQVPVLQGLHFDLVVHLPHRALMGLLQVGGWGLDRCGCDDMCYPQPTVVLVQTVDALNGLHVPVAGWDRTFWTCARVARLRCWGLS